MRSHPARGVGAWLLLVPSLSLAASAQAPATSLGLRWSDPNSLSPTTEQDFESRLSERLGRAAFDAAATERTLSVTWQGSAEQCRVELALANGNEIEGTRLIESPNGDCPALVPALLTVAALLVEAQRAEPVAVAAPVPEPAPARRPANPPPPSYPERERAEPTFLLSLGGAVSSGFAPRLELGPAAAVFWAPWSPVRVGVEGSLFFAHQYGSGPGFSLGHNRVALLVCGMPLHGRFALGLCGNAALHRATSEGISLPHPETHHANTLSTGAALRAEWRLASRLWWVADAGADVALRQLYFYYTPPPGGQSLLFRQHRVMPAVLLGLTLELP